MVSSIKSRLESEKLSTKDYQRPDERSQFIFDGECAMGVVNDAGTRTGCCLVAELGLEHLTGCQGTQ
jgi:hypothetical protein